EPTGSLSKDITIGIVAVAFCAGGIAVGPPVTITSTFKFTSSDARSGSRSNFPSAHRYSIWIFFPSTYPSSRRPCRNASMRSEIVEGEVPIRKPITRDFLRLLRLGGCAKCREQRGKRKANDCLFHRFSTCLLLFDHLIRSCQHIRRNRQADLLDG